MTKQDVPEILEPPLCSGPKVFELFNDVTGRAAKAYDAVLDQSPEYRTLRVRLIHPDIAGLPREVWFWGALDRVRSYDFLLVDQGWTVLSKRMLAALESCGHFAHAVVPAHFKDTRDGADGTLEDEYCVLVITAATDALDLERSIIEYHEDGRVRFIKKWCFKEPPQGIPPLFRVKQNRGPLLLSERAKQVLDGGHFKGIHVLPQEKIGLL